MRIMGLDIGTTRIGVALSDETLTIASPHATFSAKRGPEALLRDIEKICEENEVSTVVVGMPLSMGGEDRGQSARLAKATSRAIGESLGVEVVLIDERFTTTQAERVLLEADVGRKKRKGVVDKVAAAIILQAYLDSGAGREH